MPKIDISKAPVVQGADYPAPLHMEFADRVRRRLGDAVGITGFGVNLTTLPAGARSSLKHWHEVEDEMVFVLSGSLTLIDDDGETEIGPGEAAGFPGGVSNAHHFENRGSEEVVLLEIGTRPKEDRCHYAEHDLIAHDKDGTTWFTTRDGTPLSEVTTRFEQTGGDT
ncbi:MAG: cupin domain-containing protein [Pseudomonadota bacterium]